MYRLAVGLAMCESKSPSCLEKELPILGNKYLGKADNDYTNLIIQQIKKF